MRFKAVHRRDVERDTRVGYPYLAVAWSYLRHSLEFLTSRLWMCRSRGRLAESSHISPMLLSGSNCAAVIAMGRWCTDPAESTSGARRKPDHHSATADTSFSPAPTSCDIDTPEGSSKPCGKR
jgi:hypothetical protein